MPIDLIVVILDRPMPIDLIVVILDRPMPIDLIVVPLKHHGVILGMDWLGKYRATLDCHLGRVQLENEFVPRLSTKESSQPLVVWWFQQSNRTDAWKWL
uniref:Uncharacterized protein n=1 Tax=Brassica oleracea var. oleracea TaxID=109376 RepID=A0A0D3ATN5_BRAOL